MAAVSFIAALAIHTPPAGAAEEAFGNVAGLPSVVSFHVQSMREARFVNLVRQQADFSCGAAAMATILRYAYGQDVNETSVLRGMFTVANPDVVRQRGFSMLDMKDYAQEIGMEANGYRVKVDALFKLNVPSLALINMGGYQHFVVVKKATPLFVYVADPALGNRRIPTFEFENQWNRIVFVIGGRDYQTDNPLLQVQAPPPVSSVAAAAFITEPLPNTALMTTVGIPPANRI